MLRCRLKVHSRVVQCRLSRALVVLRDFETALGNGPIVEQKFSAVKLDLRQLRVLDCKLFVLDRLPVIRIRSRDIVASDFKEKLTLLHRVAEPGANFYSTPVASEGTGTCRETSGLTTPVTFSSAAATCSLAVANGKRSECSTLKLFESISSCTAVGTGPVPAIAFSCAVTFRPQPVITKANTKHSIASRKSKRFIGTPPCRRPDSSAPHRQ